MRTLGRLISMTLMLGSVSMVALLLQYLALSDIASQETDVTLEWRIVGVAMLVLLAFVVSTFATIIVLLKQMPRLTPDPRDGTTS